MHVISYTPIVLGSKYAAAAKAFKHLRERVAESSINGGASCCKSSA